MEFIMTARITSMSDDESARVAAPAEGAGLGVLRTERGNLPLDRIDVRADITGLSSRVELTQDFINAFDVPLEASYVFPLPDRGAVTAMRMTADGRVVEAELQERAAARQAYDDAVAAGQRASIAEEERPDVFTLRVGNIVPGERVSVVLTLVCPLPYEDGEATFRFPLVVAPRYIPGTALDGCAVGDGYADDTDAVPDASRITPPVLLPGFPNPVRLSIDVGIDSAGLSLSEVRSSLHAVSTDGGRLRIQPGERVNRDFVLRLRYGSGDFTDSLLLVPDAEGDEGTYRLTVLPPISDAATRPRDLVLVLDRSYSMAGWKMVAARRAAARIVDTLTTADRFAVLTFDDRVDRPAGLPAGLVEATDRNRYRAVEHLARVDARGGTEMLSPLRDALGLLGDSQGRDAVVVLVTDGQVADEDQILRELSGDLGRVRVHAVGIDQAVNAGFLGRLAGIGGGRCELVESEDRLDEAMEVIHRRIGAPLVHGLRLHAEGLATLEDTATPVRLPDLFADVPLVVAGRYRGPATGSLAVRGTTGDGRDWSVTAAGQRREAPAVTAQWARAHLRDLEDHYAAASDWHVLGSPQELEKRIVDTSLRFSVLCRFTAYVAIDTRVVANGSVPHRVLQPVEAPAGWDMIAPAAMAPIGGVARHALASASASSADYLLGDFCLGDEAAEPSEIEPLHRPLYTQRPTPRRSGPARLDLDGGDDATTMSNLPRPSRSQVLRDYLDDTAPAPPTEQTAQPPAAKAKKARPQEHPELTAAREQARDEATRLRAAGSLPDHERRQLLADLASRLSALVITLTTAGVPLSAFLPLWQLAAALKEADTAGTMADEALWDQALRVLDDFAAGTGILKRKRRAFWKRG
jgi:Ca-activated chloride channel homolog